MNSWHLSTLFLDFLIILYHFNFIQCLYIFTRIQAYLRVLASILEPDILLSYPETILSTQTESIQGHRALTEEGGEPGKKFESILLHCIFLQFPEKKRRKKIAVLSASAMHVFLKRGRI